MHEWWKQHKTIYMYPKDWGNSLSLFLRFVYQQYRHGILIITENDDMKQKVVRILGTKKIMSGGVCAGDTILYNSPLASMENDEVLWWDTPGTYKDPDEFYRMYRLKN